MMITYAPTEDILEITIDNPPVNALNAAARRALFDAIVDAERKGSVQAVVIRGAGKMFSAGADIGEFTLPEQEPGLSALVDRIEGCSKPVVAAIHGHCLGGGLELAMGCHNRVAARSSRMALPEVTLGLLPGAGGTQRLPRLVGVVKAIDMITTGSAIAAEQAQELGLVDLLADDGKVAAAACEFARSLSSTRRTRDIALIAQAEIADARPASGTHRLPERAVHKACRVAVKAATEQPFAEGLAVEKGLFHQLAQGDEARALQHAFSAERAAAKIKDLPTDTIMRPIARVGVLGAGTMGTGIAMNFLLAGIPVTIVEADDSALPRGTSQIAQTFAASAAKGKLTRQQKSKATALLTPTLDFNELGQCDLIIEAVFEDMAVKQDIFRKLDRIARTGAILASNTSFLDIDEMAAVTGRPEDVVGLHFFSPANVMKLVEVIRGAKTSNTVLATCMDLAKRIGKAPVLSGVCYGFIGNRMLLPRLEQAKQLLLEGASIAQIDSVSTHLGLPIGPLRMIDLAGVDIGWHRDPTRIETLNDALCAKGRFGQKSGGGFYDYEDPRAPVPSPVVEEIVGQFRASAGIEPRTISDDEILIRTIYVMINEAAHILEEGIAQRGSDIDTVWILGFGWPRWTGGPLWWASQIGLATIVNGLERYCEHLGSSFTLSTLLKERAGTNQSLS